MDGVLKPALRRLPGAAAFCAALFAAFAGAAFADGDAVRGATLFKTNCAVCHHIEKGAAPLIGPSLFAVSGRTAASLPGFAYSAAMKKSGLVWTDAQLVTYLKAPMAVVPGTKMAFAGLKGTGQADAVAAYLKTLK